jgi:hypothetical protein
LHHGTLVGGCNFNECTSSVCGVFKTVNSQNSSLDTTVADTSVCCAPIDVGPIITAVGTEMVVKGEVSSSYRHSRHRKHELNREAQTEREVERERVWHVVQR